MFKKSAFTLYQEDNSELNHIQTYCKDFDNAFGGVLLKSVTVFVGGPSSAKSQMCFQYCVNVQIPESLGGLGGQAVYVDTKLDFSAYRIGQIAEGCVKRLEKLSPNGLGNFSKQLVLDNIFLYEVTTDYSELFAVVLKLDSFIESKPNVKLIVIDSFSYLLRYELDSLERTRLANQLFTYLHMLAKSYNVAVLLTHEMTTRIDEPESAREVPALGDGIQSGMSQRVVLGSDVMDNSLFYAYVEKTFCKPEKTVKFRITKGGIQTDS